MTPDLLEDFLRASPEYQQQFIASLRQMENAKKQADEAQQQCKAQITERWQLVPKWRRALIWVLLWAQTKLTPKWL